MRRPKALELQLLLACARAHPREEDEAAIRQLLELDIDWTKFALKAIDHGLVGLAGNTLAGAAPESVPPEIREAFQAFVKQTRNSNQALLNELARLIGQLANAGVETIAFKGPVLAKQAFGDLGLRGFRDLDFLIHDDDLPKTIKVLCECGYERNGKFTAEQFHLIHLLQGQEIMFKSGVGAIEPHTRLTSVKMALDIDYDGLWRRAGREEIFGHQVLTLAPEDTMIVLAIHGGKELWWDIKWCCDVADFIASHPQLDWNVVAERARAQGCYRMLVVMASLARNYLGAKIPDFLVAAESGDPAVAQIIDRIVARWEADDPGGPPSNKTVSMDRLLLHDGMLRQASYVIRTWFLPGPQHIALAKLPGFMRSAYVPIGLAHDLIALPLYRFWTRSQKKADQLRTALAVSPIALALTPASSETRARLKHLQREYRRALDAVTKNPKTNRPWILMGDTLSGLNRHAEAVGCYEKSLAIAPDDPATWKKRHAAIAAHSKASNRPPPDDAPEFDSKSAGGWALRAGYLMAQKRYLMASEASQNALQLSPQHEAATQMGIKSRLYVCDWRRREEDRNTVANSSKSGIVGALSINLKQLVDSEQLSLSVAQLLADRSRHSTEPLWRGERYNHQKIRIAYVSTDFRNHPVGKIIAGAFEHHDKARFEITAISIGPDDGGPVRKRIEAAVDRFIDVNAMNDAQAAAMMRRLEIDIAIDLNGLTGSKRPGILACRPAPLQVNYLGYPGTMALPYIDYIIADPIVIPAENRGYYTEQIAYLPNSYLPFDRSHPISKNQPTRIEQGLPDSGFVFTSFNRVHKLAPQIFSIWMRLLHAIEGSVLWISSAPSPAVANLRREAAGHGIAPERLIFARYQERPEDHLARQCLGDLFLDTLPYNAHSTASEALWAGLPVLTCQGESFQARVASSLLHAIGLPEMVTTSLAEYEALALELARNPQKLAAIRQKLADHRQTAALFDTARYVRDLEKIYANMWQRQQSGLPPEGFSVADGD